MAAGGAMAVEDGVILSRASMHSTIHNEAFRWYEASRIPAGCGRAAYLDREQLDARTH